MQCELEGISVYYESFGAGMPVLVLHGQSVDHRYIQHDLEPIFARRRSYQRIYVDLPGHGKTDGPDWITCQDDVLNVLLGFIDKVIPEQQFLLIGSSYGGYLAQGIVYRKAQQVEGLGLFVPVVLTDRSKRDIPAHQILVQEPEALEEMSEIEQGVFQSAMVVQTRDVLDKLRMDIIPAQHLYDTAFAEKLEAQRAFSFDIHVLPQPFEKPSLMVMGRQDSVVGYRDTWKILENYPRATFAVLDQAGHFLGRFEGELPYTSLVEDWLDRVELALG